MTTVKIAALQMDSTNDKKHNLLKAEELIRKAASQGATYVVLPEYFNFLGSEAEEAANVESIPDGETTNLLSKIAKEEKIWLHGGSILEKVAGEAKYYNTTVLFDPQGSSIAKYRKIHLYDVDIQNGPTFLESGTKNYGRDIVVAETNFAKLGLSICYDIRFPELFRLLALQGAEILTVPAAFPAFTGKDHWEVLLRARAIENQAYVIASAQIGNKKAAFPCYGRSMIIDPWGNIIATASDLETIVYAEINLEYLRKMRIELPSLKNRRPEVYSLGINQGVGNN
jgi:predicted amidohydrolase